MVIPMDKQEAKERLKKHRDKLAELNARLEVNLIPYETGIDISVLDIAIECIEKQIPKKPRIEYMPLFKAYCPICGGRLLPSKWCPKCGQAILWESDTE